MNAMILFRNGATFLTAIDTERDTPETLAQRLGGGYVICRDERWGKARTIVVSLSDVQAIVLEGEGRS